MMEGVSDIIISIAALIIAAKPVTELFKKFFGSKNEQNFIVTTNGNGYKHFVSKEDLANHARECAGHIYERINENYNKLNDKISDNHQETMQTFSTIKVSLAHLESMKRL